MQEKTFFRSSSWKSCELGKEIFFSFSKATTTDTKCLRLLFWSWWEMCSWMPSSSRKLLFRSWKQHCGETKEERVKVFGSENYCFYIREAKGTVEITELLVFNSLLSEAQRGSVVYPRARGKLLADPKPELWAFWCPIWYSFRIKPMSASFIFFIHCST